MVGESLGLQFTVVLLHCKVLAGLLALGIEFAGELASVLGLELVQSVLGGFGRQFFGCAQSARFVVVRLGPESVGFRLQCRGGGAGVVYLSVCRCHDRFVPCFRGCWPALGRRSGACWTGRFFGAANTHWCLLLRRLFRQKSAQRRRGEIISRVYKYSYRYISNNQTEERKNIYDKGNTNKEIIHSSTSTRLHSN